MKEMFFVFTPKDIAAMKKVKTGFDPDNVYNPGKVLPEA
jgi:FAD/FMN-containing dehydrogenase